MDNLVPLPPEFTEEALALEFTEHHGDELRYVAQWGKWLEYKDGCWAVNNTVRVFDLSRRLCSTAASEANKPNLQRTLASAKTVAAVVRLAQSDRKHAATVNQWDADPWLLNTPGGTVDLRDGKFWDHRPGDFMTLQTAVTPSGGCSLWLAFLDRVTDGDGDLIAYLKRLTGYALTGSCREHALGFLFGTGANGKSVFVNTLAGVLGSYHKTAPMEVFTATTFERHPTELAMLRGARLVTATETEAGKHWAEARIKSLTGGDPISARFMRQDYFEFTPQFKLQIAGNHKPQLRKVDEAIRRRIHLIPFTVTIPPNERDPDLSEKLKDEWPGILQWAIEGAVEWNSDGLNPPQAVRDATEDYLKGEDAFGQWLDEECSQDSHLFDLTAILFESWRRFAEKIGEPSGSRKEFRSALDERGFKGDRKSHGVGYNGVAVITPGMG